MLPLYPKGHPHTPLLHWPPFIQFGTQGSSEKINKNKINEIIMQQSIQAFKVHALKDIFGDFKEIL